MSVHVLLNLLNELGKVIKCQAYYLSRNVRFYLSHDIKILKIIFFA